MKFRKFLLPFFCGLLLCAPAIAQITPPAGVKQSGTVQSGLPAIWNGNNLIKAGNSSDTLQGLTGELNASSCANTIKPTWCAGSDVGAWINAAIAYGTSQSYYNYTVILNAGATYAQTTTIVKPLNVKLDCQGSKLTRAATSGAAMTMGTYYASGAAASSGIGNSGGTWNCKFYGAGSPEASHTDIAMYSGTDPAGILTGPDIYGAGDFTFNVEVVDYNTAYAYGSNTWQVTHYSPKFASNYDGIVAASGSTNSGELMQVIDGKIYNNSHCGFNLMTLDHWWAMTGGSLDYNATGVCGSGVNIELNTVHLEQTNGPLITSSNLHDIRIRGGVMAVTGGSVIAGEDGWIEVISSARQNAIALTDIQFYANHAIPYITYTAGVALVMHQCYRNMNWGYTVANKSVDSDAVYECTDNAPLMVYNNQAIDLTLLYVSDQSGRGTFVTTKANSKFVANDFVSSSATAQWWRIGMNGSSRWGLYDVTNSSVSPLNVSAGSAADSVRIATTGVGILTATPTAPLDVTGAIKGSSTITGTQLVSTIATGTAPLVVTSTTQVANLNAATAGTVTTNANLTGPITSVGNATSVAAQTGTGSTFVMNTSPTITTPTLSGGTTAAISSSSTANPPALYNLTLQNTDNTTSNREGLRFVDSAGNEKAGIYVGNVNHSDTSGIFRIFKAGADRFVLAANNVAIFGQSSGTFAAGGVTANVQLQGGTAATSALNIGIFSNDAVGPIHGCTKSRNTSLATVTTIVQNGDVLCNFNAYGTDGSNAVLGGQLVFSVDGTPGVTDMPTKFEIKLSPDGSATPATKLALSNSGGLTLAGLANVNTAVTGAMCWNTGGAVTYNTSTTCLLSSLRYKKDVETLENGLAEVMKFRPVSYLYKDDKNKVGRQIGLIAEEVAQIDKRLIAYDTDGVTPQAVRYENAVALAFKAIQELKADNDNLRQQIGLPRKQCNLFCKTREFLEAM